MSKSNSSAEISITHYSNSDYSYSINMAAGTKSVLNSYQYNYSASCHGLLDRQLHNLTLGQEAPSCAPALKREGPSSGLHMIEQ